MNGGVLFGDAFRRDPYPAYAHLRCEGPVCLPNGWWAVSRYDDVALALKRVDVFSSAIMAPADPILLGADPPRHTSIRRRVARGFSARRLVELQEGARELAVQLVDALADRESCDLVADLAAPLTVGVIARMLGIPDSRMPDLRRWSDATVALASGLATDREGAVATVAEFDRFVIEGITERRSWNTGLLGDLAAGSPGSDPLEPAELTAVCRLLIIAGNETTTNLISNAVIALMRHPDVLAAVVAEPRRIPDLIEETLRFDAPVQFLLRRTTCATTLGGASIDAGSTVALIVGSANRDERRFSDADRFNLDRPRGEHLAFGLGPHQCLGADLARMEATVAVGTLLARVRGLSALDDLDALPLVPSFQLRGPARLRVSFDQAGRGPSRAPSHRMERRM